MSLTRATRADGTAALQGAGPCDAEALAALLAAPYQLHCDDPDGLDSVYLRGAREGWEEFPSYMDFLDPDSPCYPVKQAAKDVYLSVWQRALDEAEVALDVGCGIGRFTHLLLDRGADVYGVDGDERSLRTTLSRAGGRSGRLDLSWTSLHRLPDVTVDTVVACEVLCYERDVQGVVAAIHDRLRPGGRLLLSMEARWGWPLAADAPDLAIREALAGADVDLEEERFVRTVDADDLVEMLPGFDVTEVVATHYIPDGPFEQVGGSLDRTGLLAAEAALRDHPVYGRLNRLWTVVATRE